MASAIADRGLVRLRGRATLSPTERLMAVASATADLTAIGPTLGQDAIQAGIRSALIGTQIGRAHV